MKKSEDIFLILAVLFIFVMAVMGMTISYLFSSRARMSAAVYQGMSAFYLAESGLEVTTRYLTRRI